MNFLQIALETFTTNMYHYKCNEIDIKRQVFRLVTGESDL